MSTRAEAWFLYPDAGRSQAEPALRRESFDVGEIADDEVLAEPMYGCWEGNMGHAVEHRPIDLCHFRNEPRIILGNAGVLRVLKAGAAVHNVEPGQNAILFGNSAPDRFGYPERMFGYDAAGTMGCLATKLKLKGRELIPVPHNTRYSLAQWAAFSVRYITAWSNWRIAFGTYRLSVTEPEFPRPHVWGWGGGTTLAELDLAGRHGCRVVMLSGDATRRDTIAKCNVTPLDRNQFRDLAFDEKRYATEAAYRRAYSQAEAAFLVEVERRTDGDKVQVFVDHIGSAVYRASLKALGRNGVIATAGWKTGMTVNYLRAIECIERHQHVHTHYARHQEAVDAIAYGEQQGWMPVLDEPIYTFDEVPTLAKRFLAGETGTFPIYAVHGSAH